jgi:5,10-methylenetetrahydromethanopterin reductase
MLEKLGEKYDVNAHGKVGEHSAVLDDEFIDQFGVVGTPSYCIDRMQELMSLGLSRFNVLNGSLMPGDDDDALSRKLLSSTVLPALEH